MVADVDRLVDALVDAGVHEGFPRERLALASQLMVRGITGEQIALLAAWARGQKTRNGAGLIATTLADEARCREVLDDVALVAARRKAAAGDPERPFQFGQGDWQASRDPDQWDECDRARRVAARVDGDRREIGSVAVEFHISVDEAERLLAVGRELRPRLSATPIAGIDEPHEDRVKRFLDDMRKRKDTRRSS